MGIKEIPCLIDPIVPQAGVIALAGSSDTGKSHLLRQFAMAVVSGEKRFLGCKINARYNSVLYVSTEDDFTATAYLINKQNANKYKSEVFKNLRFMFDTESLSSRLDSTLSNNPADCVIIDTFTDIYTGEMNQTNKIRSFIQSLTSVTNRHNCLLVLLHHTNKQAENLLPSKANLLGSQGFEAKMRLVMELRNDIHDPSKRHLCIVKGNYLKAEFKEESYILSFDENLNYSNSTQRAPFSSLIKADNKTSERDELKATVIGMYKQFNSVRLVQARLKRDGIDLSKSTIAIWVKDCPTVQNPLGKSDTGQIINTIKFDNNEYR